MRSELNRNPDMQNWQNTLPRFVLQAEVEDADAQLTTNYVFLYDRILYINIKIIRGKYCTLQKNKTSCMQR